MINARAETVEEKPAFRSAFWRHRCLVLADDFFEWRAEGKSTVAVRLAGVWQSPALVVSR
jgi:putative SOS response-associated peptidase YedK